MKQTRIPKQKLTVATLAIEALTGITGKVSGKSTLKNNVFEAAALPAKSAAYKVTLCAPSAKPVKVTLPVIV